MEDPFFAPYDEAFWKDHGKREYKEAGHKVGNLLYYLTDQPRHVVDVGCGSGEMLAAMRNEGAGIILGIDSESGLAWCRKLSILELLGKETISFDLRKGPPFPGISGRPDLVVCVEVLEHLPEDAARRVVQWICTTLEPRWLALSGAKPGQGGTAHINEQQPLYWMNLVHSFGKHYFDPMKSDEFHRRAYGTFPWSYLINLYRRLE